MPELRIDPLSGLRTIVAAERSTRPGGELRVEPQPPVDPDTDPFLEGHEDRTPPELFALRPNGGPPDSPGWQVRVVPNLYPSLAPPPPPGSDPLSRGTPPGSDPLSRGTPPGSDPLSGGLADPLASGRGEPQLFTARAATGAHEVIVNTPRAVGSLHDLEPEELETAMDAWRQRMRVNSDAACLHLIVNEGRAAGASLPHSHAQLYALEFVPAAVARERERFTAHSDRTQGRNLLEDLLQEEVRRRERVVAIDREAVAICPFASRTPYQVQLIPRSPRPRFEDDGPLGARLLHDVLGRLGAVLGAVPPFNLWVRTAPRGAERFCWRIDLVPRLTNLAGLELGTGLNLNVVAPERAAEQLREAGAR